MIKHKISEGGFGIFYGPGQTEDQIQPIESDRISSTLTSGPLLAFNHDQAAAINAIISNFVNNPLNRAYQPRAYASEYTIPEKVYQYGFRALSPSSIRPAAERRATFVVQT